MPEKQPLEKRRGPAAWLATLTPGERRARARAAALSRTDRGPQRTARAREAWERGFYDATDPDLSPAERQRQAEAAIRAHLAKMTAKSVAARREAREAAADALEADALLSDSRVAAAAGGIGCRCADPRVFGHLPDCPYAG